MTGPIPTRHAVDHRGDRPDASQYEAARSRVGWMRRAWTRLTGHLTPPQGTAHSPAQPTLVPRPATGRLPDPTEQPCDDRPGDIAASSARSRMWLAEATRQGWNVGAAPYGYRLDTIVFLDARGRERRRSRLVVVPVEAEVVRQVFTWRAAGGLTLDQIVRRLRRDPRRLSLIHI